MIFETQYQHDQRRHKRNVRNKKKVRFIKKWLKTAMPIPKPGCRPLSILYPTHPLRIYGPLSAQYKERDKKLWE